MAKAGIITFLHNTNYGSLLQAFALEKVLETLNVEAIHLDYCPDVPEKIRNIIRSRNSPALLLEGIRKRKIRQGREVLAKKSRALTDFRKNCLRLSEKLPDINALTASVKNYDILIAGSDQIWSPVWLNPAYFYDVPTDRPKIAYACSMGVKTVPNAFKSEKIRKMVSTFNMVSVREAEGAEILRSITGTLYPVMPDPVVLLSRETWKTMGSGQSGHLFCYLIGDRQEDARHIRQLAEQLNLTPLVFPASPTSFSWPDTAGNLSPQSFIGSLFTSAHVLTDSFHGALLACIAGVPFTLIRRYRDTDPASGNSRIDQLIRDMHLTEKNGMFLPGPEQIKLLESRRNQGLEWLRMALNQTAGIQSQPAEET